VSENKGASLDRQLLLYLHRLCYHEYNMSKVANYLNEHILGEVTTNQAVRQAFSTDASVLTITPEMVVYPRTTNDIRKVARFSNQLAEKGHHLPITVRGGGSDQTGAAIGKGIILNTTAHLNYMFELDAKQKLIRVQPGVTFGALNGALNLQGLQIPSYPSSAQYSTIGGAIANNTGGILSGKYGLTGRWVKQLEVVLSSGDVIQTGRISKRELNRKKGQQTFEGELYRQIDNLITDNDYLIKNSIGMELPSNVGYNGIADVKYKDGSIDLAPLFIGSQGTLGIISEVIMRTEYASTLAVTALSFETYDAARDAVDVLRRTSPCVLEFIDAALFEKALERGKKYPFYSDASEKSEIKAVILVGYDDMNERLRNKKHKKLKKLMEERAAYLFSSVNVVEADELLALRDVTAALITPETAGDSVPPLVDGAYVSPERFEDFMGALEVLAAKFHVELPLYGRLLDGIYHVRPTLQLHKIGDKQKVFKLIDEYAKLVAAHGGHLIGDGSEGRLKAPFAYKELEPEVLELYAAIKDVFDPQGILNPGVKEKIELKPLVAMLRTSYDLSAFSNFSPSN
jgi:FAD/FMN-containing dehydrogenase